MPRILKGNTIANRFAAIQKAQRTSSPSKKTDTLKAVNEALGANFETVGIGEGMAFKVPAGKDSKAYLAGIRGKLVAVSREGQPWAGRKYQTAYDKESGEVLVQRLADGTPLPAKVGGRPAGIPNKPKASDTAPQTTDASAQAGADTNKGRSTGRTQVKDLTGGKSASATA